ncbi:hypothetical protein YPPY72_4485 [Yersinia pestis PY-72]|nr:hypothetical protein YPPY48_4499 [Yersinia pestis PY-48]EIS13842.1 hypothetical protein YPPY53_4515 [Yersinia pestis PY-53]EIS74130.1 hypothetical protein YPPY72_4485 [Yersinia pestis PY-72]EIS94675.1 hypothetical protein YPPY90_4504 [Yersinia pestis PY-90]EIT37764.1 hypothetical protein YPPY99_4530 [Yersinia pestis PY-99]EIT39032.1 hypothetical protein YPPY101_4356 [Yersinia pestis PY-101]EIT52136.1 hypothetical protein YPPY102_4419 [Yersinia pestis PY-102]EIT52271.1 hypothetical protein
MKTSLNDHLSYSQEWQRVSGLTMTNEVRREICTGVYC